MSTCISRTFLKTFFRYSWAWSKKIWSFVAEIPTGLSNFILLSTGLFWGRIYFSGKSRFFSIIFEFWVICFDGLVITACYVSKYITGENKFFWKFFYHFRTMSGKFSGVPIKISIGCRESNLHVRPKGWLEAKVCLKQIFFSIAFVHLENDFLHSGKNGKVSQMQSTCSWEQFDGNFCFKISCFSIVFGQLKKIFRPFA